MNNYLVDWSVAVCNLRNAGVTKKLRRPCPVCRTNAWYVYHGIDAKYKSKYNPGEYVRFTCSECGYSEEQEC